MWLYLQQNVDLELFYRKQPEFQYVDATEVTQLGPTNSSFHYYKNFEVPPQIENEDRYQTTLVAVRPRNSTYPNESVQAEAAGTTSATVTPWDCGPSCANKNNANDIATSTHQNVYEDF